MILPTLSGDPASKKCRGSTAIAAGDQGVKVLLVSAILRMSPPENRISSVSWR
jgi:hypothetical protein